MFAGSFYFLVVVFPNVVGDVLELGNGVTMTLMNDMGGQVERSGGVIENALNAGFDQLICDRLCSLVWDSDHGDFNASLLDQGDEVFDIINLEVAYDRANQIGISIKDKLDVKALGRKSMVLSDSFPQVAGADDSDVP